MRHELDLIKAMHVIRYGPSSPHQRAVWSRGFRSVQRGGMQHRAIITEEVMCANRMQRWRSGEPNVILCILDEHNRKRGADGRDSRFQIPSIQSAFLASGCDEKTFPCKLECKQAFARGESLSESIKQAELDDDHCDGLRPTKVSQLCHGCARASNADSRNRHLCNEQRRRRCDTFGVWCTQRPTFCTINLFWSIS